MCDTALAKSPVTNSSDHVLSKVAYNVSLAIAGSGMETYSVKYAIEYIRLRFPRPARNAMGILKVSIIFSNI